MSNQDEISGWPSNINQIKWAMRHGQKVDGLENMVVANQPIMGDENLMDNGMVSKSNFKKDGIHHTILEEKIDQLGESISREIQSLKNEIAMNTRSKAFEEEIRNLVTFFIHEITVLKEEMAPLCKGFTSWEKGILLTELQQNNNSVVEEQKSVNCEEQIRIHKKRRKKR